MSGAGLHRALYVATLLVGSFLLFLMQPMVARMALPRLGGAPAVWNSALLVYQALLLGGYAYAHLLGRIAPRRQAAVHLALLALAALWLPVGLDARAPPPNAAPELWVPWLFAGSIGPLFLVVAAQAPLMQRWFALVAPGRDPYPLYSASNLGSFAGLIAYPVALEPALGLRGQSMAWGAGYALLALLVAGCAWLLPGDRAMSAAAAAAAPGRPPAARDYLRWVTLAAVPSGLILSTTTHLSTDIVAMPLLWVVPLGLYLLSYALAFVEHDARIASLLARLAPFVLILAAGTAFAEDSWSTAAAVAGALVTLFVIAVALHRQLYLSRPAPAWLTSFYLSTAFGGVLGGLFCALLAPALFDWAYEQPLLIVAAAWLIRPRAPVALLRRLWRRRDRRRIALGVVGLTVVLSLYTSGLVIPASPLPGLAAVTGLVALTVIAVGRPAVFALVIAALMMAAGGWRAAAISTRLAARERSYFGIYTIIDRGTGATRTRELVSGTTLHGLQRRVPGEKTRPTSYYAPGSGVGWALKLAPAIYGPKARIGVVGLGAGTLACYAHPGQDWRFYEIDPLVETIARRRFSFLARCAPRARIALGDARLVLAGEAARPHDVLVIDAFSSDAVPVHLLTVEALDVYGRTLAPDGLLLMHVSNRFLDLAPVVAAAAYARGWRGAIRDYRPGPAAKAYSAGRSIWIALGRDVRVFDRLTTDDGRSVGGWARLEPQRGVAAWTDDHASILAVLR